MSMSWQSRDMFCTIMSMGYRSMSLETRSFHLLAKIKKGHSCVHRRCRPSTIHSHAVLWTRGLLGSLTCKIMNLLVTVYTIFQKAVHVADRLHDLGLDGLEVANIIRQVSILPQANP